MAARISLFLSRVSNGNMVPESYATVKLYKYDATQPNKRGDYVGEFTEYPVGSGSYYIDIDETLKGVITTYSGGEFNLISHEGMVFRSDENF